MDPQATLVTPAGGQIALTAGEARLLKLLALQGDCVEHSALAWQLGDPEQTEAVNKARVEVSRLRRKLRQHAGAGDCIRCQRHVGYELGIAVLRVNPGTGETIRNFL